MNIATGRFEITLDTAGDSLFSYRSRSTARGTVAVTAPRFEIEGRVVVATVREWKSVGDPRELGGT